MPAEAQNHLKRIEDGAHRMGMLVDELLNLARVGRHALFLQITELNSVIEDVVSLLQPEIEGRAVTWKIAQLPSAECDPILIRQVFQNLLANALKFTRTREQAVIEISCQRKNGQMVIAVRDKSNGVGVQHEIQRQVVQGFSSACTAPRDFEGTGIGLATVHRIVHKHFEAESGQKQNWIRGQHFTSPSRPLNRAKVNPPKLTQVELRTRQPPREHSYGPN